MEQWIAEMYPGVNQQETPIPVGWSTTDKHAYITIDGVNGLRLQYAGPGKSQKDASAIRASHPIPVTCGLFYFEVKVINKGKQGYIGVGLCLDDVNLNRMPGWDKGSFGYHGDDGFCFCSSGTGRAYGPTFTTNDVIGCGVDLVNNRCFYTKNGLLLATAFDHLPPNLYPCVGLQSLGETVETNFGQAEFVFDLTNLRKELERQSREMITQFHPELTRGKSEETTPPKKRRRVAIPSSGDSQVAHLPSNSAAANPDAAQIRSLFGCLLTGEMTVEGLVDSWIVSYYCDHEMGFLDLANFFVASAGCNGRITAGMAQMAAEQLIAQLTPQFDEETNDFPLIRTDKEYKKFRTDYCEFLHTLVLAIKDTLLFDDYLMDSVFQLLTVMADSSVRAFRHTATLGVLKMLTGLVEVMLQHDRVVKTDQQQLEQEENRKRVNQQRIRILQRTLNAHTDQADTTKKYFELACQHVFFVRYRDVVTAIREMCMEEIGVWMATYPERFVHENYLKYLGWTLNDEEATVRRKCLASICPLFENEENVHRLQLFSSKFKDRFVQMAADVDTDCCIRAGKILIAMMKSRPELFADTDLSRIFDLIYVTDHNLAVSTAAILYSYMTTVVAVVSQNPHRFKSGKEWTDEMSYLYSLVGFSVSVAGKTTNQAYLVDSLLDVCPSMKAWHAMSDLLLEEPDEADLILRPLTDNEVMALIIIMSHAIQQTATGEAPAGRSHPARKRNKDAKQMKDEVAELTAHFIDVLPQLISKYKEDPVKVLFLISIPQYFDVELYTTKHKEAELNALLDLLSEVYEKYDNTVFLKTAAKCLDCLEREGSGIANRVVITRTTLLDSIVRQFREALPHWLALNGENNQELVQHMESSIKRLYALLLVSDGSELDVWELLMQTLERALTLSQKSISKSSIKCCMLLLICQVQTYKKSLEEPDISAVEEHKKKAENFLDVVIRVVALQDQSEAVIQTAFLSAIDTVISHQPQEGQGWSTILLLQLSPEQQSTLANFISTQVLAKPLPGGNPSAAFSPVITSKERDKQVTMLFKRRALFLQFEKAMTCGAVLPRYASVVFKHAVAPNADYGDIMQDTMKRLQEINPVYFAESTAATLVELFTDIVKKRSITRDSREIRDVKDLAKRFAVYFGSDNNRSRSAMGVLHKYCLAFISAANSNNDITKRIIFFDILYEFHSKLLRDDQLSLLTFVRAMELVKRKLRKDVLQPFVEYENVLSTGSIEG